MRTNHIKISTATLLPSLLGLLVIWMIYWYQVTYSVYLADYAIYPRTLKGLVGIVCAPLLHASISHILSNSIPLGVLLFFLFGFYQRIALRVLLFGWLISGFFTWVIGRESYHLGASTLIYLLASFIFFKGLSSRNFRYMALSFTVVFVYGSMIWYVLPLKQGISWEGHLSGFLVGIILAYTIKVSFNPIPKYDWEKDDYDASKDEFMQHFDEQGNFVEKRTIAAEETEIRYQYKENRD